MSRATPRHRLPDDDRRRTLVTPEGIALPLTLASRAARAGALLIDLSIIGLLIVGTTVALLATAGGTVIAGAQSGFGSATANALQFLFILWIAAMFLFRNAYFLFFELGPRGATPGKRLAGIRIAARDGGRLSAEMVIARNLLRDIELFLPLVLIASASNEGGDTGVAGLAALAWFLVFVLFPMFNRDRLRAGDLIAGSWVVEAPKRKLEPAMTSKNAQLAPLPRHAFTDAELAVYGEYELQTLERILRENRKDTLRTVHATICGKIGRNPAGSQPREFLTDYYLQLRARLEAGLRLGRRKVDKFD